MFELEETLDVTRAARILGCTVGTLRNWCSQRQVPYYKVGGLVRFRPSDLLAYLEARRVTPAKRVEERD